MFRSVLFALCVAVAFAAPQQWMSLTKAEPADSKVDNTLHFEPHDILDEFEALWEQFKNDHSKAYESGEENARKDIFKKNVKKIQMHNYLHDKGLKTYRLGVNEYADMEHSEFVSMMNGYKMNLMSANRTLNRATYMSPLAPVAVPSEVDWRKEGYVTPVKNQGQCGSCWSFSATGSLEGQHFRQSGTLTSLSEQNLVDCSAVWGNNGCNGGLMDNAFQYIKDNGGIDTEDSYPYTAQEGTCHYKSSDSGATDIGFTDLPEGDESKLQEALATVGPISIAIDASHPSFQLYKSGVYIEPECSSEMLDHGVLAVGYGSMDGQEYWIVKNSWGETWGQEGYIFMARNKDNQCGVASKASYPLV